MSRMDEVSRLLASQRLTRTELADGSGVLLDHDTKQVVALNETGMFLADLLRQGATRDDLARLMAQRFHVTPDDAARDLDAFVEDLARRLVDTRSSS